MAWRRSSIVWSNSRNANIKSTLLIRPDFHTLSLRACDKGYSCDPSGCSTLNKPALHLREKRSTRLLSRCAMRDGAMSVLLNVGFLSLCNCSDFSSASSGAIKTFPLRSCLSRAPRPWRPMAGVNALDTGTLNLSRNATRPSEVTCLPAPRAVWFSTGGVSVRKSTNPRHGVAIAVAIAITSAPRPCADADVGVASREEIPCGVFFGRPSKQGSSRCGKTGRGGHLGALWLADGDNDTKFPAQVGCSTGPPASRASPEQHRRSPPPKSAASVQL